MTKQDIYTEIASELLNINPSPGPFFLTRDREGHQFRFGIHAGELGESPDCIELAVTVHIDN